MLVVQGDKVSFNAYHKNYAVPAHVQAALALLNDRQSISLRELCAVLGGDVAVANLKKGLAMLAAAGVVLVEN